MLRFLRIFFPATGAFIFLSSCGESKLPKYTKLEDTRILALVASSPEVDAGATATITPIVSDITETSSLSFEAKACLDPGVSVGADPTCEGSSSVVTLGTGTLNSGDMVVGRLFTGAATAFSVTAPASSIIFAQRSSQDQHNGVSYLVTYKITNSSGNSVQSFKRLIVSTKSSKNQNPTVSQILSSGSALPSTLPLGQTLNLSLSFGAVTNEAYPVLSSDGSSTTKTEDLTTTWFFTDGELKYFRTLNTDSNDFTTPSSAVTGRDSILLAITRDNRGGVSYVRKCFGTCP